MENPRGIYIFIVTGKWNGNSIEWIAWDFLPFHWHCSHSLLWKMEILRIQLNGISIPSDEWLQ